MPCAVNFNPAGTPYNLTLSPGQMFIAKYSPVGKLIWVDTLETRYLRTSTTGVPRCTSSGQAGNVFVAGNFQCSAIWPDHAGGGSGSGWLFGQAGL